MSTAAAARRRSTVAELQVNHLKTDPFLLEKWECIFSLFFDKSGSQQVEWGDFYHVVRKVRALYGAESAQYDYAKKTLESLWEGLCKIGDEDGDQHIVIEEWIDLMEKTLKGKTDWFRQYQHFMFKLFNVSASGSMDEFEYVDGMSVHGFTERQSKEAFKRFAVDKKGNPVAKISPELWEERFNELFFSKDKKAVGNHMFGIVGQ